MTAFERGQKFGEAFGYLLVAGLLFYFAVLRPWLRKRKKKKDETLDEV
jgi:preprotein translocase subunit YajC